MVSLDIDDTLEPLGIVVGALLVLFGIGTLAGQPWTVKPVAPLLVQVIGVLAMVALGLALVWVARR